MREELTHTIPDLFQALCVSDYLSKCRNYFGSYRQFVFTWFAQQPHTKINVILFIVNPLGALTAYPNHSFTHNVEMQSRDATVTLFHIINLRYVLADLTSRSRDLFSNKNNKNKYFPFLFSRNSLVFCRWETPVTY